MYFELSKWLQDVAKSAQKLAAAWSKIAKQWQRVIRRMVIMSYTGNPKVKHLALHARKARTRKKNYHRILKENRRER